ncbi:MAG: hypothetical protein HY980_01990 [Candidatus Magasanikbacteria bacterium]|nr:hypothetical protein [Candidatus Magasanikbacteria bacterium]
MRGPEFRDSRDALKESAWKVLQKETEDGGIVSVLIGKKGITRDDTIREMLEFVRDEVTRDIVRFALDINNFCDRKNFRMMIYANKITDFFRDRGLSPFVDVSGENGGDIVVSTARRRSEVKDGGSMDAPHFVAHFEAMEELAGIIKAIGNEEHKRRLEVILKGAALGWTNNEIIDELERIEGKRVTVSRIPQVYAYLRKRYLGKFLRMPATWDEFRSLIESKEREITEDRARKILEYSALLSKELGRLAGESQTAQTKEEILLIEYLLGKRSRGSLADGGLSTNRNVQIIKARIASRLFIPYQDLHWSVLNRQDTRS